MGKSNRPDDQEGKQGNLGHKKDERVGSGQETLVMFWKSEGRVHLEMAAPVWSSGLTLMQRKSLERCQRVAMAAIVGHWAPSQPDQLAELGLTRLDARREKICARFALSTGTRSRHRDIFVAAQANFLRLGKLSQKFVEPRARTVAYRKSAVPYLLNSM